MLFDRRASTRSTTIPLFETMMCIWDKAEPEVDVQTLRGEVELHDPPEVARPNGNCHVLIEERYF